MLTFPLYKAKIKTLDLDDLYYAVMEITFQKESFKSRYIEKVLSQRDALAISFDKDWWPIISETAGLNSPPEKRTYLHDGIVAIETAKDYLKRDWRNKGSGIPGGRFFFSFEGIKDGYGNLVVLWIFTE